MPTLFDGQETDGDSSEIDWNGNRVGSYQAFGTWDGATVTIKGSLNNGSNYNNPPELAITVDEIGPLEMGPGKMKATISFHISECEDQWCYKL